MSPYIPIISHWIAAGLLIATATFALLEAKSSALIPKSLFLWPLSAFLFGLLCLEPFLRRGHVSFLVMAIVIMICAAQAFLVNIRKLSRWPSGAVWLGLLLIGLMLQVPNPNIAEPVFQDFYRRLAGFVWIAIGVTKVIGERSVSDPSAVPVWIQLVYVQAALVASSPF